jgi:hypothetical protein
LFTRGFDAADWIARTGAVVIKHGDFASREAYDTALVAELRRRDVSLVCLAGCSGGPTTSSFFSSATNLFSGSTKISLAPIVGAPQPIAEQFTQALVVAGKDRHLTILPAGAGGGSYTLRGYLLASSEKGGSKISYIWDVTDAKGNRVARVSGDELVPGRTADPWDNTGTVLNSIAGETTPHSAGLPNGGSVVAVSSEAPPAGHRASGRTAATRRRRSGRSGRRSGCGRARSPPPWRSPPAASNRQRQ